MGPLELVLLPIGFSLVIILLIISVTYRYMRAKHRVSSATLPGPIEPLEESEVYSKKGGGLYKCVSTLHEKYGPLLGFSIGDLDIVSIGSPELFKQHQHVFDRPVELFMRQVEVVGNGSIQIANGDRGKHLHKSLSRPFSFSECKRYYPEIRMIGERFINKLEALPKGEHIPVSENMLILTVKEVSLLSFGYDLDDDEVAKKQMESYKNAFGEIFYEDDEDSKAKEELKKQGIDDYRRFVAEAMANRLKNRHLDSQNYFADTLLDMGLEKDEELDNAVTFFTGAFHTTAYLMTWLLYYVGKYPDVQSKIRQELEEILEGGDVDHENIHKLRYLHQVIDETLRHSCLAPFAARVSSEDTEIGGFTIPANTPVIHCLGYSLSDPNNWSPPGSLPPSEFDPSRFSPENAKTRPSLSFSPFGFAGKRICPGYRFAYVVVAVLVSQLLRRFKIRLLNEPEIYQVLGFVTKPNTEIFMAIEDC